MNLQQTIEALEFNHITVALDIGVHQHCDIDSNCPVAVGLRRVVTSSGITPEQLLARYASVQGDTAERTPINLPQFDGKTKIRIANQDITVDLTQLIQGQLGDRYRRKVSELDSMGRKVEELGKSLHSTLQNQIYALRNTKNLPQLKFSDKELIDAGCYITSDGEDYIFLFPRTYCPQYIVHDAIRYELSKADKEATERKVIIKFQISRDKGIFKPILLDTEGNKFEHYHGRHGDCWGQFALPPKWDGKLKSLVGLVYQITGALYTINFDSLMQREPPTMPHIQGMLDRATKLGEEGRTEARPQPPAGWTTETATDGITPTTTPARAWGRRGR